MFGADIETRLLVDVIDVFGAAVTLAPGAMRDRQTAGIRPIEAEEVLSPVDVDNTLGIRDRAILETLHSTGIRRTELTRVAIADLDFERGTPRIRYGKGRKERVVVIGERAIAWIARYVNELRPQILSESENGPRATDNDAEGVLFLCRDGRPITPAALAQRVQELLNRAGFPRHGSCHLFRHTAATLMLEGGADVRYIQAILGHADLSTTAICTRVSIQKLKDVHTATHPSAKLRRKKQDDETEDEEQQEQQPPLASGRSAPRWRRHVNPTTPAPPTCRRPRPTARVKSSHRRAELRLQRYSCHWKGQPAGGSFALALT